MTVRRLLLVTGLGVTALFTLTAGVVFGLLAFTAAADADETP